MMDLNQITETVSGAAIEVRRHLGPGLMPSIHEARLLSSLRPGGWKVGLLINFNMPTLKDGIKRRML